MILLAFDVRKLGTFCCAKMMAMCYNFYSYSATVHNLESSTKVM